jgi:hypothetical protein
MRRETCALYEIEQIRSMVSGVRFQVSDLELSGFKGSFLPGSVVGDAKLYMKFHLNGTANRRTAE